MEYKMKDFEKKLKEFAEISNKLASEDISLSESLELYEKGNILYKELKESLDEAENKVLTLEQGEFKENGEINFG